MRLRREKNKYLKDYYMSGWEKTIKTPKMVRNIANCSKHICMGSRSMFAADNLIYDFTL